MISIFNFTVTVSDEEPVTPFLHDIKSEWITPPGEKPIGFNKKTHPAWQHFLGTDQLVDPAYNETIGVWNRPNDCPLLFLKGFMRINPDLPSQHEFSWDPNYRPYRKEGNFQYFLLIFS